MNVTRPSEFHLNESVNWEVRWNECYQTFIIPSERISDLGGQIECYQTFIIPSERISKLEGQMECYQTF